MANGDNGISLFISYSRDDSELIDRLDADLRARGYHTWVDRRKLEGGQDWEREIGDAIARQAITVVALSPMAVQSPYVRFEYERALSLGKRIIPLMVKTCPFPSALGTRQWVNFTTVANADSPAYRLAFKELVYVLQDPSFDLTADPNTLYNRALSLEATNPEQAVLLLQRTLDRDPNYFGGEAARHLERLEAQLYNARAARLAAQAKAARRRGAYGEEAGALEALLALGRRDTPAATWASEYLPIARQNRAFVGPYEVIQQRIAAGDLASARQQLTTLWSQAPYFGDPAGIAAKVGLTRPMGYEAEKAAEDENERWRHAQDAFHPFDDATSELSASGIADALRLAGYDLPPMRPVATQIMMTRNALAALSQQRDAAKDWKNALWNLLDIVVGFLCIPLACGAAFVLVTMPIVTNQSVLSVLLVAAVVVLALAISIASIYAGIRLFDLPYERRTQELKARVADAVAEAQQFYQEWLAYAEPIHRQRLEAIAERDRRGEL